MKIRRLADILKENSEFVPQWKHKKGALTNPKFGSIEQICVCDDFGTPKWDQYQIKENKGAIIIPYFESQNSSDNYRLYVGLIKCERFVPEDKDKKQGIISLEFPRGVGEKCEDYITAAKRELFEETGKKALQINKIGEINPNTAFYVTSIPVYQAEIDRSKSETIKNDGFENILKAEYFPVQDVVKKVGNGEIVCGLTKAAFMHFIANRESYLMCKEHKF